MSSVRSIWKAPAATSPEKEPGEAAETVDLECLLARVNPDGMLRKAEALGAGERWITVHPNGSGEKGTPILIKIQPFGSAKVLGGAGSKLNHLRLHGVKSEAPYRVEA